MSFNDDVIYVSMRKLAALAEKIAISDSAKAEIEAMRARNNMGYKNDAARDAYMPHAVAQEAPAPKPAPMAPVLSRGPIQQAPAPAPKPQAQAPSPKPKAAPKKQTPAPKPKAQAPKPKAQAPANPPARGSVPSLDTASIDGSPRIVPSAPVPSPAPAYSPSIQQLVSSGQRLPDNFNPNAGKAPADAPMLVQGPAQEDTRPRIGQGPIPQPRPTPQLKQGPAPVGPTGVPASAPSNLSPAGPAPMPSRQDVAGAILPAGPASGGYIGEMPDEQIPDNFFGRLLRGMRNSTSRVG